MSDTHVIASAHLPNLRDVGGWPTVGGATIRPATLYRSAALNDPAIPADADLNNLGLDTVIDLRTTGETDAQPDHVTRGATYLQVDILADQANAGAAVPAELAAGEISPAAFSADLDGAAYMRDTYRAFVSDAVARRGFSTVIRTFLEANGQPILIHCTAGKDRTGWATATLMAIAEATPEAIRAEYLAVQPAVTALFAPTLEAAVANGADPEKIHPFFDVRPEFLQAGLDQITKDFGTLEGYLRDGLELTTDEITEVREILVKI